MIPTSATMVHITGSTIVTELTLIPHISWSINVDIFASFSLKTWHLVQATTLTLGACQSIYLYLHLYFKLCHTDASSMTVMTRFGPDMRRHGLVGRNVGNSREPRRVSWWLPFPAGVSPSSLFTSAGGGASSVDRVFCLWHEAMSLFVSKTKLML